MMVICFLGQKPMEKEESILLWKNFWRFLSGLIFLFYFPVYGKLVHTGKSAPSFKAMDTHGIMHQLSDYKGKTIVLEWSNPHCPYVRKHYKYGNLVSMQQQASADNIVWFVILSAAPGKPGYADAKQAEKYFFKKYKSKANAIFIDETGDIGTRYGAKSTPHIFIINAEGILVYSGAIDNKPSVRSSSLKKAKNYVLTALSEIKQNKPVSIPETRAYGCAINY